MVEITLADNRVIEVSEYDLKQLYYNLFIARKHCLSIDDFILLYKQISEMDKSCF